MAAPHRGPRDERSKHIPLTLNTKAIAICKWKIGFLSWGNKPPLRVGPYPAVDGQQKANLAAFLEGPCLIKLYQGHFLTLL